MDRYEFLISTHQQQVRLDTLYQPLLSFVLQAVNLNHLTRCFLQFYEGFLSNILHFLKHGALSTPPRAFKRAESVLHGCACIWMMPWMT